MLGMIISIFILAITLPGAFIFLRKYSITDEWKYLLLGLVCALVSTAILV